MEAALADLDRRIAGWRFEPHPRLAGGHLQTFAGALWRRRFVHDLEAAETRRVRVDDETEVVLRCSWLPDRRSRPTLLLVHGLDGYTTNVPVEDLVDGKGMIATHYDGEPLAPEHGGPARLLVPHLYFWKSAKWVRRLRFMDEDAPGCP